MLNIDENKKIFRRSWYNESKHSTYRWFQCITSKESFTTL